jgi:hypothetical protein
MRLLHIHIGDANVVLHHLSRIAPSRRGRVERSLRNRQVLSRPGWYDAGVRRFSSPPYHESRVWSPGSRDSDSTRPAREGDCGLIFSAGPALWRCDPAVCHRSMGDMFD